MANTILIDEQLALSMCAGAKAIETNRRLDGTIYIWDFRGKCGGPKEISYYEAAKRLREIAESVLNDKEWENGTADNV